LDSEASLVNASVVSVGKSVFIYMILVQREYSFI